MRHGFSLLEVLCAATVLFIGIAVVMSSLSTSFSINSMTEEQNIAIAAMSFQTERLKSMEFAELEAEFGADFSLTSTFQVEGLANIDGSGIATGTISAVVPDPPDSAEDLVEFTITVDYESGIAGISREQVIMWESPNY